MTFEQASIELRNHGYNPTSLIHVSKEKREIIGLRVNALELTVDDHCKKISQLLPTLRIYFNPNTSAIEIDKHVNFQTQS